MIFEPAVHRLTPKVRPEQARTIQTTGRSGTKGQIIPMRNPKISSIRIIVSPAMAIKKRTKAPIRREINLPIHAENRALRPGDEASPVSIWRKGEKKVRKIVPNEK